MKKVLVFGIFDGLHPGHINFLKQAKKNGDFLIVAVGRASACQQIKCKVPRHSLLERIKMLQSVPSVSKVVPGDIKQGSYRVILREKPDMICLGYDQQALAKNVHSWLRDNKLHIKVILLKPYKAAKYHTSILQGERK